jgi:hypothetical protein
MGKLVEGFMRAKAATEEREAEARSRAERTDAALRQLSEKLAEDREALDRQQITMRIEHGSLVLRRMLQPLAGATFDPDANRFNIHEYSVSDGKTETEAQDADECALKLGEYSYSLKGNSA